MVNEATNAPESEVTELQAELASARADLVDAIVDLKSQFNGPAIAERAGNSVKQWFLDSSGGPRVDRIAIVGGVVLGMIVLRALGRRR